MKAVNLLPSDLRSGGKSPAPAVSAGTGDSGGAGAFIVLGALALCVCALAGYILTSNAVKDREAELAEVTAQSAATTREVQALKPYADFASIANARVQTVNDLATQRFDWEQAIRDLSRTLPADVTLASLNGTLSSGTGSAGGGAGSLRGALDVPAIELEGCTSGQSDVASLMSRLRGVDGVTRVSLSKSDKESPTARSVATTGDAATAAVEASACGFGDKPSFALVIFFENDAAAVADPAGATPAAGGATAAPASGAAPASTPAPGDGSAAAAPAATATPAGGATTTTSATTTEGQAK
jgi:Tfp pilus assembly protein PilN